MTGLVHYSKEGLARLAEIKRLRKQGQSNREIGEIVGISRSRVIQILKLAALGRYGVRPTPEERRRLREERKRQWAHRLVEQDRISLERWRVEIEIKRVTKRRKEECEAFAAIDICIRTLEPTPYSDENVLALRWLRDQRDLLTGQMKKNGDWGAIREMSPAPEPVESVRGVHLEWLS